MRQKILIVLVCVLTLIAGYFVIGRQRLSAQGPGTTLLLYSFVTNLPGFDTKLVITNASVNPFGTDPSSGSCVINYYGTTGGSGPAPAPQTTSTISGGTQASFTLSGGGAGIRPTPGFQGYIVAACNFSLGQGVAAISDSAASQFLSYLPASVLPAF